MAARSRVDIAGIIDNQEKTWFAARIFLLCCVVMLADGFDNQAINYAAPSIIAEWGINRALMTPVFNLSIVGAITGAILFATLGDRYGRRPAAIGAVALFGGFTLAIPLAHNIVQLSLLRFFASSLISAGLDLVFFTFSFWLTHNILTAMIAGRLSSLVNFALNRKIIRRSMR